MTYRPSTVKQIVPVELSRPRDIASLRFTALQKELTDLVMEEQMRSRNDEARCLAKDDSAGEQ